MLCFIDKVILISVILVVSVFVVMRQTRRLELHLLLPPLN